MRFGPRTRTAVLALHLTCSVGWVGGVIAYLALGVSAVTTTSDVTIRAAWSGMATVGWYALVPLAVGALVTGIGLALGTRWGLLRHYWVVISLIITALCVVILVAHMPGVSATVEQARTLSGADLAALGGDLPHPAIGLVLLLVVQVLNIVKPRGLTRYGQRRNA